MYLFSSFEFFVLLLLSLLFSDFAPTLYLISITTVQNNLRNCNCLLCDLIVDFRLYLNESSEEDRESEPSDDEARSAGPPSQFAVINYYVKSRMFCISVLILRTLFHKLVYRNKRDLNHSSVSVTRFIRSKFSR